MGMGTRHEKSGRGQVVVGELHEFRGLYRANALYGRSMVHACEFEGRDVMRMNRREGR